MIKMIMEKSLDHTGEGGSEESESRPSSIWSFEDLKTTVSRAFNNYRQEFGQGQCFAGKIIFVIKISYLVDPADWDKVGEALEKRKFDERESLNLMGQSVLQMKLIDGDIHIRKFAGLSATSALCKELILSKQMFNDHMPWGYDHLFSAETEVKIDLNILDLVI